MPQIDVSQALEFLKWLGQERPSLYTLPFDGRVPVLRSGKAVVLPHILGEFANTYYSLALVKQGVTEKASKDELVSTSFLHVDLDPRDGADTRQELTRLFDSVTANRPAEVPAPSAIVMSGRGVQALWRLKEPISLPGGTDAVESANKWLLECLVGPPGTHNVDRILRLPGSWNCLVPKKLALGYEPAPVTTYELNDKSYSLADFGKFEPSQSRLPGTPGVSTGSSSGSANDITAPVEYTEDLEEELRPYKVHKRILWLIAQGHPEHKVAEYEDLFGKIDPRRKPSDRSAWVYDVNCNLLRAGVPDGKILGLLIDKKWPISGHCTSDGDPERQARRQVAKAKNTVAKDEPKDDGGDDDSGSGKKSKRKKKDDDEDGPTPLELASWLMDKRGRGLVRVNALWMTQQHHAYRPLEDEAVRQEIYAHYKAFDSRGVSRVLDALKAHPNVYRDKVLFRTPCWLDARKDPDPKHLIVVRNGMVDITTSELLPFDSQFYTICQLDFDFDPNAAPPVVWLGFLHSVWPDDPESIEALQMWFGYCLTQDTSLQKILNLVGPKRSGKGTIAYVLEELIGEANRCGPSLNDLGSDNFGLESWIGKQVAVVGDVRIGARTDREVVLERLLQVIGEDLVSIRRKGIPNWEGRLSARVVILSNSVLDLQDEAGAFISRLLVLATTHVFEEEKQDTDLKDKLKAELPSIMSWALEGLKKLRTARRIKQPAAGRARLEETVEATTPREHPWEDIMANLLGNKWGKLLVADAWMLLGQSSGKSQKDAMKLGAAMKKLGWERSKQRHNQSVQNCFVKDLVATGMPVVKGKEGRFIIAKQLDKSNRFIAEYEGQGAEEFEVAAF